jgi:hypothetical protein
MAKSCSLFYSWDMNIHDVVEPRDIFFQQHWEEYYFFRKKSISYDFIVMFPLNAPHIIIWSSGKKVPLDICLEWKTYDLLEKINCDRFYTFQCPTPFKRQRRDVGRVGLIKDQHGLFYFFSRSLLSTTMTSILIQYGGRMQINKINFR